MNYQEMVIPSWFWLGIITAVIIASVIIIYMIVLPIYNVWVSKKQGEAELAEANFAEQVVIAKATARLNAAEMNKKAEVIEAEAVANSIQTIGDVLSTNEGYLRWQWIKMMGETDNETIYVPTEANLPILEAGRKLSSY